MIKDIKSILFLWKEYMYILTPMQKFWGVVVFILSLFGAVAELLSVSVILPFIQALIEPAKLLGNRIILYVCQLLQIEQEPGIIRLVFFSVILLFFLKNIFLIFIYYVQNKYSLKINRELSVSIIHSYMNRGYLFFRKNHTAVLMRGCGSSVAQTEGVWIRFFQLISEILTVSFILIYISITDFFVTMVILVIILFSLLFVYGISKKVMKGSGREYHEKSALTQKRMLELFHGIREIFAGGKERVFLDKYETSYIALQRADVIKSLYTQSPMNIIEFMCVTGLVGAIAFRFVSGAAMDDFIPKLAVFAMAAFRVMPSIGRISSYGNSIIYAAPAVNEVYSTIKEAKDNGIDFSLDAEKPDDQANRVFQNSIQIKNLAYRYPDAEGDVLHGINMDIRKGESIGIVGESGAGKSTLANIFLGLLPSREDTILMDGVDVEQHRRMWINNVGYVPQSTYLMDDTIRRNIAFGEDDENIDDDWICELLKKAQLYDYVCQLPDGIDTLIGERGVRFSGGQAQRLALARALYHDPEILILDEATSALDNETERAVMDAINSLQGHKTMIIIAHRLTTIKNCNRIYEIKDGKAYERKYEELINE